MYHPDSDKNIIVLKEVVGEAGDISRRFIIRNGFVYVQYWSRIEMQWFDLSNAKYSARTIDLFSELMIEHHNEIARLKKLVEDTAKTGEDLIVRIEERQSKETQVNSLEEWRVSENYHKTDIPDGEYYKSLGFMHGYKNALKDLTTIK